MTSEEVVDMVMRETVDPHPTVIGPKEGDGIQWTLGVDKDDPRWRQLDRAGLAVIQEVSPEDYPVEGSGIIQVDYRYLVFSWAPNDDDVLREARHVGCRRLDRAELMTFVETNPGEQLKGPIVGIVGPIVDRGGERRRAYVNAHPRGVSLIWRSTEKRWPMHARFIVALQKPS